MTNNPNAEDQSLGKKLAQSMGEFPLKDSFADLHRASAMTLGAGSGGAALAAGLKRSMIGEPASASARIAGELNVSKGIDAGGFAAYQASARKPAIAEPIPLIRKAGVEEVRKIQNDMIRREQLQRLKQESRAAEGLELQRRIAEASEAALKAAVEAERARTAVAKEDADAARIEARTSRSHMRISLWFAAGSFLVAVWALLKDQF